MYYSEDKILDKLNISATELSTMKLTESIFYSKKTDKYDLDSCLETRTMTIGLENHLNNNDKSTIVDKMNRQSSFYRYLFSQFQKDGFVSISANESSKLCQDSRWNLMSYEGMSAHAFAVGQFNAMKTWFSKTIDEIETKIMKIRKELDSKIMNVNKIRHLNRKLRKLENKLEKHQSLGYLKTWFGKKDLINKDNQRTKTKYKKSRLSLKIQGESAHNGNRNIRIQHSKKIDEQLDLKIYKILIENIKIPKSHQSTFSLDNFNRQSCNISYNSRGKLVLHITYSYIKPIIKSKSQKSKGMIGIDIGPKEIAVAFVKNDGNPLFYRHYPIGDLLDKSNENTNLAISLILDKIIQEGIHQNFTEITIENLNFSDTSINYSKKLNRMLSSFPHAKFEALISSKCSRFGIKLKKINPAYTSIQGIYKYSNRDNLSTNHNSKSKDLSAALTIGRRGLGFHEKSVVSIRLFGKLVSIPIKSLIAESEKDAIKFGQKSRNNNSNWSLWSRLHREHRNLDELTAHVLANPESFDFLPKIELRSVKKDG